MNDTPEQKRVYIGTEYHEMLAAMAEQDKRGMGAENEFLIEQEAVRRKAPVFADDRPTNTERRKPAPT